jgi:hypothetical protein
VIASLSWMSSRSASDADLPARSEPVPSPPASSCLASRRSPRGRLLGPTGCTKNKSDRYRVIARKDTERVRLWARTTSDYSHAFTRIRNAVAALPVITPCSTD